MNLGPVNEKMKYKDPFLGEIELTKVGETSRNAMGESVVETIYVNIKGDFYIDTWVTTSELVGGNPIPMKFLRKELIEKLSQLTKVDTQKSRIKKKLGLGTNITAMLCLICLIGMGSSVLVFIWDSFMTAFKILLTFGVSYMICWILNKSFINVNKNIK
jgi:hypothetical protein